MKTMSLSSISQQIDQEIRSDKDERYLPFYAELFGPIRSKAINILEVGVLHGGALLMFAQYFENARLLGIDINPPSPRFYDGLKAHRLEHRVAFARGSQSDKGFLDRAIHDAFDDEKLDVVIDEASHIYRHSRAAFDHIFYNYLKSGGIYVIEDWGCGYWPKWPDGDPNGRSGLPRLVKEIVDLVALQDRTALFNGKRAMQVSEEQPSPIARMIIIPALIAVIKA
jgi:SAM-dependent methyltransferase